MNSLFRNTLAVILGLVIGSVVNMALVTAGPHIIPLPPGVDVTDAKSWSASLHLLEPKHFLFPFLAHALGTLTGSLVGYLIALTYRAAYGYAIGILFLVGGIAATSMIPAPGWFIAVDLGLAYLPMAWLGVGFGRRIRHQEGK